jgi:hypothetical protein
LVRFTSGLVAGLAAACALCAADEQIVLAQEAPAEPPVEPPAAPAAEPPAESPSAEPAPTASGFDLPSLAIHGFVSQGAFLSTDNDFLGRSERGSVEFLEAALNVSTEVTERLRIGAQLFTRDLGPIGNYTMNLDWAFIDYKWRDWLGLRAGRIKMPFGLYNEFADIDAARTPILLPQSVYPITSRDFQLAQTGFSIHGSAALPAGGVDYQLFGGALFIAESTFLDTGAQLELVEVDTKYVAGGQLFWRAPVTGLRIGASALHTNLALHLRADQLTTAALIMAGVVPMDFDGSFEYGLRDVTLAVGSIEYALDDWLFSAEYSRWVSEVYSTIPMVIPGLDQDEERFYGMVSRSFTPWLELGTYYSIHFFDIDDRDGNAPRNSMRFRESHRAYIKDLALSTRFDINDYWLWKLEAHYMDGTGGLADDDLDDPDNLAEHWGFFLIKTTVSF